MYTLSTTGAVVVIVVEGVDDEVATGSSPMVFLVDTPFFIFFLAKNAMVSALVATATDDTSPLTMGVSKPSVRSLGY